MVRARQKLFFLLCAALAFFLPLFASAETRPDDIPLGLYLNESFQGNFSASLADEEPAFYRADLLPVLRDITDPAVFDKIFPAGESEEAKIPLRRLREAGLTADFSFNLLEVSIQVPPELRKMTELRVLQTAPASLAGASSPASASGYLNLYFNGEHYYQTLGGGDTDTRLPLSLMAEPTLNLFGYVAEGNIFFETYPERDYSVDYARLVRDFPSRNLRVSLGSIDFPSEGMFIAPEQSAGAAIVRDLDLSFTRRSSFSSRREIFLPNPATVTVLVNGQPVRTFRLAAGRHTLGAFPFLSGLNTTTIEIREEGQAPRYEEFSIPFDSDLLAQGEYTYFAGLGTAQWSDDRPLATGFFRRGITEPLTLGLHAQAGGDAGIGGLEAIFAAPFGNLKGTAGLSAGADRDPDFGTGLQYRFAVAGRTLYPIIGLGTRYTGAHYLQPESLLTKNAYAWQVEVGASQYLPYKSGLNLSFAYRTGRGIIDDSISGTLGFSKNFDKGFSLSCNIGADRTSGGGVNWRGGIYLTSVPPGSRSSFHLSHDLEGGAAAYYQVRPKTYLGSPGFTAAVTGMPFREEEAAGVRAAVQYNHELFESSLSDSLSRGAYNAPVAANSLAWSAASSVAFADGAWGLSRPIRDGFAIVVPGKTLKDKEILINHGADYRIRTAKEKMTVVLPNLRAYTTSKVHLNVPELPLEQQAEVFQRLLAPTYKTGYALRMEAVPRVFGGGRLVYEGGEPVVLEAGEVYSPGNDAFEAMPFYTDETGIFQFFNLVPGVYGIRMYISETAVQEFTIPEGREGFFDIGDVKIPASP